MSFLEYQKQSPEFLNNYLKYKRFIECCSSTTVDQLYFDLRTFFRYIYLIFHTEQGINDFNIDIFKNISIKDISLNDMQNINYSNLKDFVFFINIQLKNSSKTSNRKIATIKRFFEYLSINNYIPTNPAKVLEKARVEKRQPKYLTLDECKQLLSKTIISDNSNKIRNYAITCLFLNSGLRLSELVGINISNMKLDEKTIKVNGKGDKERITYLNKASLEAITKYLIVRPKLDKSYKDYDALFLSNQKKRISRRNVETIIKNELNDCFADTKDGLHTHSLRHTSATLLYNESNVDILVLKRILGHSSLSSTEIYTHIASKKMKEIMQNCTISSILERKEMNKNGI